MTVLEFHEKLRRNAEKSKDAWPAAEEHVRIMESCTYIWNEDACAGYVLNAMQYCGVDDDLIIKILNELYLQIDEVSFEDAAADAKRYLKNYYAKKHGQGNLEED